MPASNPSPPPDASGTVRGLVSLITQTFAGVKTFTSTLIASAGIQLGLLFNTNGTGASDVGVKVGTSTADGTVNAAAKLLSVRTGLNGGAEVESVYVTKTAIVFPSASNRYIYWDNGGGNRWEIEARPGAGFFRIGNNASAYFGLRLTDGFAMVGLGFDVDPGFAGAPVFRANGAGRCDQRGTNSGTVGADTQNFPVGINTLASGATSVTITNSHMTTTSRVSVTFHADPGGRYWVTRAAGSFTVNVSAAPGANAPFSWEVSTLL